jgi:cytochrome c peroxidase
MKNLLFLVVILLVVALAFPIANLLIKPPQSDVLTKMRPADVEFQKVAQILETKCVFCHVAGSPMPFYTSFPIARTLIAIDIAKGLKHSDFKEELAYPEKPVSEVALAKLEYSNLHKDMPPIQYLAMHWNHALSSTENQTIQDWIKKVRGQAYATPGTAPEFATEVVQPIPSDHGQNPQIAALGDKMFHDVRLSADNTLSCASCHDLKLGGTDRVKFSKGINGAIGDINSPTVYNSGFQFKQFWDGRAATLEEQADGPVNNPIEMGSNWEQALPKLQQDGELVAAFTTQYSDGLTSTNVMNAIATYERTLVTPNSRFDQYLQGKADALNAEEKTGYEKFTDLGCTNCHVGKALGGQSFEPMGLKKDYFADRGNVHKPDYGRFNFSGEEKDRYKFKVPTLRNIAQTAPYFHDASTEDLSESVHTMIKYQTEGKPIGSVSTEVDLAQIVAFLKTLTGEYNGQPVQ